LNNKDKAERWKQYIEELYQGTDGITDVQNSGIMDEQGGTILKTSIKKH
jgi:hypothetical protein